MKRDNDYLRTVLFDAEADEDWLILVPRTSDGDRKMEHHVDLLCDAGLFRHINEHGYRLTSNGHDFLDAIRDDTNWNKVKTVAANAGGVGLGLMCDIALGLIRQKAVELGLTFI